MYTFDEVKEIEKHIKKFLLFFLIGTALFITLIVLFCRNWGTELDPYRLPSWPAYTAGILYAVITVFTWSMIGVKLFKYRSFVYNLLNGLEHNIEGKLMSVSENVYYDNDLEFYTIEIKEDGEEENRLLHLDALKDISQLKKGEDVKLKIFGNYIKDVLS